MNLKLEDQFTCLIDALQMNESETLHIYKASSLEVRLSNKQIINKATVKARKLLSITNKECILIDGENNEEFITNFFAVMLSQNIPVPVTTDLWINEKRYQEIIKSITLTTKAKIILGGEKINPPPAPRAGAAHRPAPPPRAAPPRPPAPADPAPRSARAADPAAW